MKFINRFLTPFLLLPAVTATALVRHVPAEYTSIQQAITDCATGDTVLIQPGTYTETISFPGRDIVVGSLFLTTGDTTFVEQTIIDGGPAGDSSVVRFVAGETRSARLSGLTITRGYAHRGGGIYCDGTSPTLDHLWIVENTALFHGGGLYADEGAPLVSECRIAVNAAQNADGGGICALRTEIIIDRCTIHANQAKYRGAGIFCENAWPKITGNTITENIITALPGEYCYGGGIVSRNCAPLITDNVIAGNDGGEFGGGMFY